MRQKPRHLYYIEWLFLRELLENSSVVSGAYTEDHAGAGALAAAGISELRGNSRNLEEEIAVGAEPEADKEADKFDTSNGVTLKEARQRDIDQFKKDNPGKNVYDYLHSEYENETGGSYNNQEASKTLKTFADDMGMSKQEFINGFNSGKFDAGLRGNRNRGNRRNNQSNPVVPEQNMSLLDYIKKGVNIGLRSIPFTSPGMFAYDMLTGNSNTDNSVDTSQRRHNLDSLATINRERLPVTQSDYNRGNGITQYFSEDDHPAIDISLYENSPIIADNDGVVTLSRWQNVDDPNEGYGQYMDVDYGNGVIKRYAHLNRRNYQVGNRVRLGDELGLSGNTGRSTGPHLHYEIRRWGRYINPFSR